MGYRQLLGYDMEVSSPLCLLIFPTSALLISAHMQSYQAEPLRVTLGCCSSACLLLKVHCKGLPNTTAK